MPVYRGFNRRLTRAERYEKTDQVLEKFGLTRLRKNNAARLSGGEKRRLEIARCLVCNPLLILLDEPFTGIDPQTIADIKQIVRGLRAEGIGILVTDHQVREVLTITDRSYLIKDGQVRTKGTPQELIHDPVAIADYFGESFTTDGLTRLPSSQTTAPTAVEQVPEAAIHQVVEQEKVYRLIERLRNREAAAAQELLNRGPVVIPALLEALERRDVELRRNAFEVLQRLTDGAAAFDPYAPEVQRRQQLAQLRDKYERKAG
jgi:ABC-type multidrug transport system ATPase subunit